MKKNFYYLAFVFSTLIYVLTFSSCTKKPDATNNNNDSIQQGDTTIEVNLIPIGGKYSQTGFPEDTIGYQLRLNAVVNAPINFTLAFYLTGNKEQDVQINLPAGYENLLNWQGDNYLNYLNISAYSSNSNDSGAVQKSFSNVYDASWHIDSVEIKGVSSSNKNYGFKVLDKTDWTSYYVPHDSITSIYFVANTDTISYSDYDFNLTSNTYSTSGTYAFYFPNPSLVLMFSGSAKYPLQKGITLDIPLMVYAKEISIGNGTSYIYYGSQPDGTQAYTNYSTVKINITNVTDKLFDANFSGNIYSSRQPDTLFITNGIIKNAPLPTQQ